MEPKIVDKGPMHLVGILRSGRPQDIVADISEIWNDFMQYDAQLKPYSMDQAYYGAWFGGPSEIVEYIVGIAVEAVPSIPKGLVERRVPAAKYAVFDCTVSTFGPTSDYAYGQWLPAAPYQYDMAAAEIEYYPPDTLNDDSPTSLSIPIKVKEVQRI